MAGVAVYHGNKNISGAKVAAALTALEIPFDMVTARDIANSLLGKYSCIVFPGGHSILMGKKAEKQLVEFLKSGGGFVGICAGAQFGIKLGLLPVTHKIFRASGILDLRIVAKHPLSSGYKVAGKHKPGAPWKYTNKGRMRVRYANGGILVARKPAVVVASFDEHGEMGAVVAGKSGKSRIVLITPHPESTPAPASPAQSDSDKSQDPLKLFANAVHFAQ